MVGPKGYRVYPFDPRVLRWAVEARKAAEKVLADPAMGHWYRHGRTWFVGVDALPSGADGAIGGVPLEGAWPVGGPWHPGQLSVVFQGYPGRDPGESDVAHQFRVNRCAAHLDGLLAEGPERRRFLREPHAFVLGIALDAVAVGASPLVVWEGSQEVIRETFADFYQGVAPEKWCNVDVTEGYQEARRKVFETCRPVEVPLRPGEAVLMHRLAVHGVAPWRAGQGRRAMAYFRPLQADVRQWLEAP